MDCNKEVKKGICDDCKKTGLCDIMDDTEAMKRIEYLKKHYTTEQVLDCFNKLED
jgi:hypothetical protein